MQEPLLDLAGAVRPASGARERTVRAANSAASASSRATATGARPAPTGDSPSASMTSQSRSRVVDSRFVHFSCSHASFTPEQHAQCATCNPETTKFADNYVSTTKYSVLTFLPRNLWEQFHKMANTYFLIVAILSTLPVSPKTPLVSIIPLVFVLSVTAVKEAAEDWARYKMDQEVNSTLVDVWDPALRRWVPTRWMDVRVGHAVRVTKASGGIPADLLLLQSSEAQGMCNIETSNLDGETNLKIKQASPATWRLGLPAETTAASPAGAAAADPPATPGLSSEAFMESFQCVVESSGPTARMDESSWQGNLYYLPAQADPFKAVSVGMNQLLLRGCSLKNTAWIVGLAVFTGRETKLVLNSRAEPFKRSHIDRIVDKCLILIFAIQAALCLFGAIAYSVWSATYGKEHWFLEIPAGFVSWNTVVEAYLTYLVLLDILVPISLYVSMEMVKFAQTFFINWDLRMYYSIRDSPAKARTSNLNEELGQIDLIFSDKTGTLTRNVMDFLRCSIDVAYGPGAMREAGQSGLKPFRASRSAQIPAIDWSTWRFEDHRMLHHLHDESLDAKRRWRVNEFLTCMAACHTIIVEPLDETAAAMGGGERVRKLEYRAASPDEKALALFAAAQQYYFYDRVAHRVTIVSHGGSRETLIDGQLIKLNVLGQTVEMPVLEILEFTSARKRMSVVVLDPRDGLIKVYVKGADSVVETRLSRESRKQMWAKTTAHLDKFATEGLRTLVCGVRTLTPDQFVEWWDGHLDALSVLGDARAARVIESYDRLESEFELIGATAIEDRLQEGVPEAIAKLADAGIGIWVLTGDKTETAINIGRSCRLLRPHMDITMLTIPDDIMELCAAGDQAPAIRHVTAALTQGFEKLQHVELNSDSHAVVVSGRFLGFVFSEEPANGKKKTKKRKHASQRQLLDEAAERQRLAGMLLDIALRCRAVICSRVSPSQKALVVQLVREAPQCSDRVTLGIGDGANDVPMLKAAHVGIGIQGEEGMQAVMSSDYSMAQFRFLLPLLLVHGAWNYRRLSRLILYSFYKNCALSLSQVLFAFYSGFSGQMFFDPWLGSMFNMLFTAAPVLVAAVFDRDYERGAAESLPQLYWPGHTNAEFNLRLFGLYLAEGLYHALVCFFTAVSAFGTTSTSPTGQENDLWMVSTSFFGFVVFVTTAKMALETRTWVPLTYVAFGGSIALWFIFVLGFNATLFEPDMYMVSQNLFGMPEFWWALVFCVFVALIPEVAIRYLWRMNRPTPTTHVQEYQYMVPGSFTDLEKPFAGLPRQERGSAGYGTLVDEPASLGPTPRTTAIRKSASTSDVDAPASVQRAQQGFRDRSATTGALGVEITPLSRGYAPFMEDSHDNMNFVSRRDFLRRSLGFADDGTSNSPLPAAAALGAAAAPAAAAPADGRLFPLAESSSPYG